MSSVRSSLLALGISFVLVACGGTPPEPEAPDPEPAAAQKEEATPPEAEADAEPEEKDEPEPAEAASPRLSPKEVVSGEGILFAFSFRDSEAYTAAEKKCDESSGGDPQKRAACMTKAADEIGGDSLLFKREADETWWWMTIRRSGAKTTVFHKVQFEFGEEKDDSITLLTKGRDKGSKPWANVPKQVVIQVPSGNEIVLVDPKRGKMVYTKRHAVSAE
jgi:hypothetical protein